jgi:hypothetical protein
MTKSAISVRRASSLVTFFVFTALCARKSDDEYATLHTTDSIELKTFVHTHVNFVLAAKATIVEHDRLIHRVLREAHLSDSIEYWRCR